MAFAYTKLMQAMVAAGVVTDPYFNLVTLLLPGNGTNGAQNNTFLDSSSNNFTITRNGNTTQGTFSPFSQTGWSNYFDGTGDYLQTPSNSAFAFGTGDYTIEGWFYPTATTANVRLFEFSDNNDNIGANFTSTGTIGYYNGSTNTVSAGTPFTVNQWNHVAAVRSSGTVTVYVNGTSALTQASTPNTTSARSVGIAGISNTYFSGYISNVRILKGTAQYTSNFTPPTSPLTAITNTQLLTCQSNRFIDNSSNAFSLTVNGDTKVQAFSPFAPTAAYDATTVGGSGYFDGNGDYLTITNSSNLNPGTGDFTFEFWAYWFGTGTASSIFEGKSNGLGVGLQSGKMAVSYSYNAVLITDPSNFPKNTWTHVAATRSGTTLTLWINGVSVVSATNSTNFVTSTTNSIGWTQNTTTSDQYFDGYISGIRFLKGTAQYTTTFTPPTAPPTDITNTQLLCNYTNAGITDATAKNDLETVGNASISTTQSKFGGSSMYFDGTGDYLPVPASQNFAFRTGDFTIEAWIYLANTTGDKVITDTRNSNGNTTTGFSFSVTGTALKIYTNADTSLGGTLASGSWYHVALVRFGSGANNLKAYINGTATGTSATVTNDFSDTALTIGAVPGGSVANFNGYIDDLRITKGYARYTANFTPPTAAFPVQ